jgi:hypothetical protein
MLHSTQADAPPLTFTTPSAFDKFMSETMSSFPRRLLHAGEVSVVALDRCIPVVDVHIDDEFELVVGDHARLR